VGESLVDKILDGVRRARGEHHVARAVLLYHHPHAANVIPRMTPVTRHVNAGESQGLLGPGERAGGNASGDSHRDETAS